MGKKIMANNDDDKKQKGTDISSLLFPAVEAARKREQAFLKSQGKGEENPEDMGTIERLNSANVNSSARLYQSHYQNDPWREEHKGMADSPLYSHLPGRLAMRAATRGLLGASFMAVGASLTRTYDWHAMEESYKGLKSLSNTAEKAWGEQNFAHRGMYRIAKTIDHTVGKTIQAAAKRFYRMGEHEIKYTGADGLDIIKKRVLTDEEADAFSNRWVTFRGKQTYSKASLEAHAGAFEKAKETFDAGQKAGTIGKNTKFKDWNPTTNYESENGFPLTSLGREFGSTRPLRGTAGRTLGEEVIGVTTDFALGSTGDALGMEMFSYLDPNVKKDWKDEKGVHLDKLAQDIGSSLWTVATYRQMEDWAAALPYVYQMKAHRQIIPKFFKGAKYELDRNTGGSTMSADVSDVHVTKDGVKTTEANVKIVGDYTAASAIDLQARFMGYNWYTLMFRDMYHHAASKLEDLSSPHSAKAEPDAPEDSFLSHPISNLLDTTAEAGKYVTKSFIKSAIYMAPAVVPFWAVRIPLDLDNGMIFSKEGLVTSREEKLNSDYEYMAPERPYKQNGRAGSNPSLHSSTHGKNPTALRAGNALGDFRDENVVIEVAGRPLSTAGGMGADLKKGDFSLSDSKNKHSVISRMSSKFLEPIKKTESAIESVFSKKIYKEVNGKGSGVIGKAIDRLYGGNMKTQEIPGVVAHDLMRGAFAYTPYMMAKAETANLYDTPEMDASIYRMLDGATSFNSAEFSAGMKDIGRVITLNPASKVTQAKVYDGRGIAHSKQRDSDSRAKSQGEILTTHHEASKLVSKIKREHAAKEKQEPTMTEADTTVLAGNTAEQNTQTLPDTQVSSKNSWQRLHVDQVNRDDNTPPPSATIH